MMPLLLFQRVCKSLMLQFNLKSLVMGPKMRITSQSLVARLYMLIDVCLVARLQVQPME